MLALPRAAEPLIAAFAPAFTRPSFERFVVLLVGAILTVGRRTVSRLLWTLGPLAHGHPSSYHRLLSRARWRPRVLGRVLTALVLEFVPADEPVLLAVDDTVTQHRGRTVWGKGCHRDAVRSSWSRTATKWGHRWVVVAVLVQFPFAARRWALPVLCALYRKPDHQTSGGHKTPCRLTRGLLATLLHGFPQRRWIVLGDAGLASHDLAWFAHRHRARLTLVGRLRGDANLYALPDARRRAHPGRGRCRKGRKLSASPRAAVAAAAAAANVGGVVRQPHAQRRTRQRLRRVVPRPRPGTRGAGAAALGVRARAAQRPRGLLLQHGPDHDPHADRRVVRRPLVDRSHLPGGPRPPGTGDAPRAPRGVGAADHARPARAVQPGQPDVRAFAGRRPSPSPSPSPPPPRRRTPRLHHTPCYHKAQPTFADALYAVRRDLWARTLLQRLLPWQCRSHMGPRLTNTLLAYLAEAA